MKVKMKLIKRNIAGDVLLVPAGNTSLDLKGMIVLNDTGEFLWDNIEKAETQTQLAEMLLGEYDVAADAAAADTEEFLAKLRGLGVID